MSNNMRNLVSKSVLRQDRGMTLVELMASMGIAAAVMVSALALYNTANDTQKSNQMIQDIESLRSATKQLYSGQGNYSGMNNGLLISAGKVPTTLRTDAAAKTITSRDGYSVAITPGAVVGVRQTFDITLTGAPAVMCQEIATRFVGYISLKIGAAAANTVLPITPADAETQCAAAGTIVLNSY